MSALQQPLAFAAKQLDGEIFLARRLKNHLIDVFAGITDTEYRKQRFRKLITETSLDAACIGKRPDGRSETYAAFFERLYGEPLVPPVSRKKQAASTT